MRHLRTDYRQANLSLRDRALLDYVAKMARNHSDATQADVQRLRDAGFTDADILHIVYWIAGFNMANTITDCLGYEEHEHITAIFVDQDIAEQDGDADAVSNLQQGEIIRPGWEKAVVRALEGRALPWLNSPPLTWRDVRNHVLVVMYWDAVHPNSLIGLPYLQRWSEQYAEDGLIVLAPHTPELEPAKDQKLVERVIERTGLTFPIIQDPTFRQVQGANNRFWPAIHLIDRDGYVRYRQHGPGGYAVIEELIAQLLDAGPASENGNAAQETPVLDAQQADQSNPWLHPQATPEFYAAFVHGAKFHGIAGPLNRKKSFTIPDQLEPDVLYVEGEWIVRSDGLELASEQGRCCFRYTAQQAGIFLSPAPAAPATLAIQLDGTPLSQSPSSTNGQAPDPVVVALPDFVWLVEHAGVEHHQLEVTITGKGSIVHRINFLPFRGETET